jgi:Zn-finger nucleic acid-binding protein
MKVETLNCPNCGAGVESDRSQCEFCKTRLKTVACPKCLGLMFFGGRFCGHCGTEAVKAQVADDEYRSVCPRCAVRLQNLKIEDVSLYECTRCSGSWSDVATFERICLDQEAQSAVLSYFVEKAQATQLPVRYVPCPQCKQLMNRSNFARSSGVIVDLCKEHGVWFDAGELPKIIHFINSGGLARAREKEKIALEEEREKIREERRQLELYELRSGSYPPRASGLELSAGGLVKALFDL